MAKLTSVLTRQSLKTLLGPTPNSSAVKTTEKGDLALHKVSCDLSQKGHYVFFPLSEHCTVDLIAYKDNNLIRLQVKSSVDGYVRDRTVYSNQAGIHVKKYSETDFDYYAIYLSSIDRIIYVPIILGSKQIRYDVPKKEKCFYWYEDFLDFRVFHNKRTVDYIKARISELGTGPVTVLR